MATLFGSLKGLIHDVAAGLVDNQIAAKVSNTVTGFVSSGFGVVDDVFKIVRDVTTSSPPPPQP
jgi:hypothetical protein